MALITTNLSRPKRVLRTPIWAPVDLGVTPPYTGAVAGQIKSGELLYLTSSNKIASLATAGSSNANAAKCVGVALDVYPLVYTDGITGSPVPPGDPNVPGVQYYEDGDHLFETTSGDTYEPYATLYLGAYDSATGGRVIQLTSSGTSVGYVSPDQRPSGPGLAQQPILFPISGGSGVFLYVRIVPALAK